MGDVLQGNAGLAFLTVITLLGIVVSVSSVARNIVDIRSKRGLKVEGPIVAQLKEEFATRREHDALLKRFEVLEAKREGDMREIRALVQHTMDKVEDVAQRDFEARQELTKIVQNTLERIARTESHSAGLERWLKSVSDLTTKHSKLIHPNPQKS